LNGRDLKKKEDAMADMVASAGVRGDATRAALAAAAAGGTGKRLGGMTPQVRSHLLTR
jgi:hypothetical protein